MPEEVIELSIAETNALRLKLGLKPLEIEDTKVEKKKQVLDKFVNIQNDVGRSDNNELRQRIDRLRSERREQQKETKTKGDEDDEDGKNGSEISCMFSAPALFNASEGAVDTDVGGVSAWAQKMRSVTSLPSSSSSTGKAKNSSRNEVSTTKEEGDDDLKGLKVAHSVETFRANETTVLTLADEPILERNVHRQVVGLSKESAPTLENVNLREKADAKENLRKKRKLEKGMGHAGGYAAWDDDEFDDEMAMEGMNFNNNENESKNRKRGFILGQQLQHLDDMERQKEEERNTFFDTRRKVSLHSSNNKTESDGEGGIKFASDFMTEEEYNANKKKKSKHKEKSLRSFKKKNKSSKKKKAVRRIQQDSDEDSNTESGENGKLKEVKSLSSTLLQQTSSSTINNTKLHHRRRRHHDDDDDENDEDTGLHAQSKINGCEKIEQNVTNTEVSGNNDAMKMIKNGNGYNSSVENKGDNDAKRIKQKLAVYDSIVEKGNERSRKAFTDSIQVKNPNSIPPSSTTRTSIQDEANLTDENANNEEEEEDPYYKAAMAKAKRLKKLKALHRGKPHQQSSTASTDIDNKSIGVKNGEENFGGESQAKSIIDALNKLQKHGQSLSHNTNKDNHSKDKIMKESKVIFEFDPTREFTRKLMAQKHIEKEKPLAKVMNKEQVRGTGNTVIPENDDALLKKTEKIFSSQSPNDSMEGEKINTINPSVDEKPVTDSENNLNKTNDDSEEKDDADMETPSHQKLQQQQNQPSDRLNLTSDTSGLLVNRGLSSTLSLLRTTGSLPSVANSGGLQEKLRGRAKDHRNYEDYRPLNLGEVTSIGNSKYAADKEFTKREVKLEYRDDFGRLLTSKEAFRQVCYQFHGYGSGKKNEERRIKLIERERQEEGGKTPATLGALKAAQLATGSAFLTHKT